MMRMKIGFLLTILWLAIGCEPQQSQQSPAVDDSKPIRRPLTGVTFSGGDGSSIETAVIIKAPNNFLGVRGELDWIKRNCPGWQFEKQSVLKGGGKVYDKMYFITPDGQPKNLFFDVTDFYGKR